MDGRVSFQSVILPMPLRFPRQLLVALPRWLRHRLDSIHAHQRIGARQPIANPANSR
jgi:hypothetical protein